MTKLYTKAQIVAMKRGKAVSLLGVMGRAQLASLAQQFGVKDEGERAQLVQSIVRASHPLKPCGCGKNQEVVQRMLDDVVAGLVEPDPVDDLGQGGPVWK